jgi:hypothetical protein
LFLLIFSSFFKKGSEKQRPLRGVVATPQVSSPSLLAPRPSLPLSVTRFPEMGRNSAFRRLNAAVHTGGRGGVLPFRRLNAAVHTVGRSRSDGWSAKRVSRWHHSCKCWNYLYIAKQGGDIFKKMRSFFGGGDTNSEFLMARLWHIRAGGLPMRGICPGGQARTCEPIRGNARLFPVLLHDLVGRHDSG